MSKTQKAEGGVTIFDADIQPELEAVPGSACVKPHIPRTHDQATNHGGAVTMKTKRLSSPYGCAQLTPTFCDTPVKREKSRALN